MAKFFTFDGTQFESMTSFAKKYNFSYAHVRKLIQDFDDPHDIEKALKDAIAKGNIPKAWHQDELDALDAFLAKKFSYEKCAKILQRSTRSIAAVCVKHQIGKQNKRPYSRKEVKEHIQRHIKDIRTYQDVLFTAMTLKTTVSQVQYYVNRFHGPARQNLAHENEIRELAKIMSKKDIAKKLGIKPCTVANIATRANIPFAVK